MKFYAGRPIGKRENALFPRYGEREKWKSADGELSAAFLRYGETVRTKPAKWRELTRDMYGEFSVNGNRSRYEDLYFERRYDLIDLVICECLEGKGRYFDAISCAIKRICDELSWCLPAHNPDILSPDLGAANPTVDLFAADTAATLACSLYLLGDELKKLDAEVVACAERELDLRVKKPYLERDFWWTLRDGKSRPCNWCSWISANLLLTFTLTECDECAVDECAKLASETVRKLYDYLPDDGECDEGVAYWNVSPLAIFDFTEIMSAATGGKQIALSPKLKKFAAYPYSLRIADGKYFNFGDCSLTPALDYPAAYRFAAAAGNAPAADYYRALVRADAYFYRGRSTEMTAYRALSALFTDRGPAKGDGIASGSGAYYGRGKLMTVHAGEFAAAAKGGGADGGHSHQDAGNYIIYKSGKPVAIDAGSARYTRENFSAERGSLWYVRSCCHNLPSVNGIEEREHESRTEVLAHGDGFLRLDMTGAYHGADLISYIREISAAADGAEVRDEMEFAGENNRVEFHIMTAVRPEEGDELRIGNAVLRISSSEKYSVKTEKIELSDDLLRSQWGNEIYRVTIFVKTSSRYIGLAIEYK